MIQINKERLQLAKKDFDSYHDLKSFCQENGLLDGAQPTNRADELLLSCFLHEDNHPSLSVNFSHGWFHCLSCGFRGSSTAEFVHTYKNHCEGYTKGFVAFINDYVKSSPLVSARLGFTSIFEDQKQSSFDLDQRMRRRTIRRNVKNDEPKSFLEVVRFLKKKNLFTLENKIVALRLMQQDYTPDQIYNAILDNKLLPSSLVSDSESTPIVDFTELL